MGRSDSSDLILSVTEARPKNEEGLDIFSVL